jgi:hypothetical protein
MYLDGSRLLHERACALDMDNQLYTFHGAGHVPYFGTTTTAQAYMDTTVNFYRDFLVRQLGCTQTALQPANNMAQEAVLYSATYCDGSPVNETCGIASLAELELPEFLLYPNPASNEIRVELNKESVYTISVLDLSGRMLFTNDFNQSSVQIDITGLSAGNYIVRVVDALNSTIQSQKLIVH